jgi:hypothetical protein
VLAVDDGCGINIPLQNISSISDGNKNAESGFLQTTRVLLGEEGGGQDGGSKSSKGSMKPEVLAVIPATTVVATDTATTLHKARESGMVVNDRTARLARHDAILICLTANLHSSFAKIES